ncbi:MAG TPA: ribose 5-phosphate isomerase A [Propionibacteriaceae bacterium]|nr:ribose 5-phosphate isomerase A [Propionibacteriaceae bacterium]
MGETDPRILSKQRVGIEAASMVQDGAIVGLGSGSTAAFATRELGRRVREEGLSIVGVPTSFSASMLARELGIPIRTLDDVEHIDIAIDGADEVDPDLNLIKGGGAAHTREKVIDYLAELFIVVVDETKLVQHLGETFPVPVEVIPMAVAPVIRQLRALGGSPEVRRAVKKDGPVISDQGNFIVDVRFDAIGDPQAMEIAMNRIPGVVENGIFTGVTDIVLVGMADGSVRRIE